TMEKRVFHLNKMKDPYKAVVASASMPIIFGPTKIDDFYYVDGGILDNYPVEPLLNDQCNLILTVALDTKFNPYLYDQHDINIIDFTSQEAFERSIIKDSIDTLSFNQTFKDEKALLGYVVGQKLIEKMYQEGIIKQFLGFKFFKKLPDFKVLKLDEQEEIKIRNLKIETKKELKKQEKLKKKLKKREVKNEQKSLKQNK